MTTYINNWLKAIGQQWQQMGLTAQVKNKTDSLGGIAILQIACKKVKSPLALFAVMAKG